jgi:hypothetical protein
VLWDVDPVREYAAVNGAKGEGGSLDGPGAVVVRGIVFVNSGRHAWERAAGVRTERTRSAANVRHSALKGLDQLRPADLKPRCRALRLGVDRVWTRGHFVHQRTAKRRAVQSTREVVTCR